MDIGAGQIGFGQCGHGRVDVQAVDMLAEAGQQGGQVAAAGTDFQHLVFRGQIQLLHQARFHLGFQHAAAVGQRQFGIDKGNGFLLVANELFAFHVKQKIQHLRVEHIPRANLLFDHVEPGFFKIH